MVDFDFSFEDLKGPLLFISGMMVGVILVAIIWYIVHTRKAHRKRQEEQKSSEEPQEREVESEGEPTEHYSPGAIIVQDDRGDYLLEDKSQLGGIIDFKKVPRRESDRQQARRDLVIQMLIAESMSK